MRRWKLEVKIKGDQRINPEGLIGDLTGILERTEQMKEENDQINDTRKLQRRKNIRACTMKGKRLPAEITLK